MTKTREKEKWEDEGEKLEAAKCMLGKFHK